jgi:hypothetical protein
LIEKASEANSDDTEKLRQLFSGDTDYRLVQINFEELIRFIKQDHPHLNIEIGATEKLTPVKDIKEIAENPQMREYVQFLKSVSSYKFEVVHIEGLKKMMRDHPKGDFENLSD